MMKIQYSEKTGAWGIYQMGTLVGEAATKPMAELFAAAPDLLVAVREAVAVVENHTPFGGIAAKWGDVIENAAGG